MYDRNLIEYLPENLRTIKENEAILTMAEQPEMVDSWESLDNALNDQFISDATRNGVSRLEKIMKIVPKEDASLDERKFTISVKNSEQPPFTITALKNQLNLLCGEGEYEVTRNVATKMLIVKVALTAKNNYNAVGELLERFVPANMVIDLGLKYNRHSAIEKYKHEQLESLKLTHEQLRNEVMK